MDRKNSLEILSHVIASYTSRELDRTWLDQFMGTSVGSRLLSLDQQQKYTVEFLSYLLSAWLINNNPDPSVFRSFVNRFLADVPSEIAKRMMTMPNPVEPQDLESVLVSISDKELASFMEGAGSLGKECPSNDSSESAGMTWAGKLASSIDSKRNKLRDRSWRKK